MASVRIALTVAALLFLALIVASFLFSLEEPVRYLRELADEEPFLAGVVLFLAMFAATVVAPLAVLPAVPAIALVLGPVPTALWSIAGWTAGGVVAFLIARHLAKPVLTRFVSLAEVARYERVIPENAKFWWVVLLRMVVPVDVLSYAIGLVSSIPLSSYALATLIGVAPFSFVFAYLGEAFFSERYYVFGMLVAFVLVALSFSYYLVGRHVRR